ncbi:MAG TPA: hypothetical protein VJ972_01315, partial [Anaerolineales bacterium]|nr:hypothetical protein [Anaerolineales bacterium]
MSKYIATRAQRGANALVTEAEIMLNKAINEKGADTPVSFPNTAYYLPTIFGMTGKAVEKLGELQPILKHARDLLHPIPAFSKWTPYLGETLDSGMATLLAAETIESVRFAYGLQPEPMPGFKLSGGTSFTSPENGNGSDGADGNDGHL